MKIISMLRSICKIQSGFTVYNWVVAMEGECGFCQPQWMIYSEREMNERKVKQQEGYFWDHIGSSWLWDQTYSIF